MGYSFHAHYQGMSPAQIIFGRNMIEEIYVRSNWNDINQRLHLQAQRNNHLENKRRIEHHYNIGDKVLIVKKYEIKGKLDHY